MAQLLPGEACTVTMAHSRTKDLGRLRRRADIPVVAAGRPGMVKRDRIRPDATVVDVGINRIKQDGGSRLTGDVDPAAAEVAGALTPVPGGVDPMTIACLSSNTLTARRRAHGLVGPAGFAA